MRFPIVVLVVVVVACTTGQQPTSSEWLTEVWEPTRALLPLPDDVTTKGCENALVELRDRARTVGTTPSSEIAEAVDNWLRTAETLMFDCAAALEDLDYRRRYENLDVLAQEVEDLTEG